MSATRLIIRLFLVAILIGMGVLVFAAWRNSKPEHLLSRAQSKLDAGDANGARLRLQNMIERFPDNADAHRLLAQAWLKEAEAEQKPATYFRHPQAFASLIKAAELAPDNIELQKEVLDVYLRSAQPLKGVKFADNILKKNPDDLDAQFVKAVQGVNSRSSSVVALLHKLQTADKARQFQLLLLELDYYNRVNRKDEKQQVLTKACDAVAAVTSEQINTMTRLESDAMTRLIRAAVGSAPDANTALQRTEQAVGTLTKFPLEEKAVLADVAQITTELMLGLQHAFPAAADTPEQKQIRTRLQQQADELRNKTLTANVATPLVFHQAALHSFTSGDHEKAAATIQEGLAPAEKHPSAKPEDTLELHLLAARNYLIMRKHREAQPHLDALLASKDSRYSGWGELLSGAVNAAEGRYEKAYQHFVSAERKLGTVLFVHMGLANSSASGKKRCRTCKRCIKALKPPTSNCVPGRLKTTSAVRTSILVSSALTWRSIAGKTPRSN
jgi:tetratricopeptide (TPR) repeat protein